MEENIFKSLSKPERKAVAEIIKLMQKQGYILDGSIKDARIKSSTQKLNREAYENTKKLLESYRDIAWAINEHADGALQDATNGKYNLQNINGAVEELFKQFDLRDESKTAKTLKSSISTVKKSYNSLKLIDDALEKLRSKPHVGQLYYDILYVTYIEPVPNSVIPASDEIIQKLSLSRTNYYKNKTRAIDQLSYLLWNVPSGKPGLWLKALLILAEQVPSKNCK